MTSRRVVGSVAVLAAGLLGLSGCSGDKPSGLAPFTPSASSTSSSPSPTSTSKWTPEQQQVIDGYDRYNELMARIVGKADKIDMAKVRQVAKEPYATKHLKDIDATLSAGFIRTGKVVNDISEVTLTGDTATIKTCLDLTRTKFVNTRAPATPVPNPPPSRATISLAREGGSWLVSGLKGGEGRCVLG